MYLLDSFLSRVAILLSLLFLLSCYPLLSLSLSVYLFWTLLSTLLRFDVRSIKNYDKELNVYSVITLSMLSFVPVLSLLFSICSRRTRNSDLCFDMHYCDVLYVARIVLVHTESIIINLYLNYLRLYSTIASNMSAPGKDETEEIQPPQRPPSPPPHTTFAARGVHVRGLVTLPTSRT